MAKWLLPHLDRLGYLKGFWYTSGVLMLRVAQGSNVPALAHASSPSGVGGVKFLLGLGLGAGGWGLGALGWTGLVLSNCALFLPLRARPRVPFGDTPR